ncbi:hypothetical protein LPJ58_004745, partial [Coemansia sp. RSA 1591]
MNVRSAILLISMVAVGMSSPVPDTGASMPVSEKAASDFSRRQIFPPYPPRPPMLVPPPPL